MSEIWPWAVLAGLGIYHGINPGMGWLFAVSLGLQERRRSAVVCAFWPIVLGHFASIAAVVLAVAAARFVVDAELLRWTGAAALAAFGLYKLLVPMSHPRWVGMRVDGRQLALWSFLMATAHGAGLMVVPVVLRMPAAQAAPAAQIRAASQQTPAPPEPARRSDSPDRAPASTAPNGTPEPSDRAVPDCHQQVGAMARSGGSFGVLAALAGVGLHTLAMFAAMAGIALLVYDRIGLAILRTAWFNLDLVWAGALILAGLLTVLA